MGANEAVATDTTDGEYKGGQTDEHTKLLEMLRVLKEELLVALTREDETMQSASQLETARKTAMQLMSQEPLGSRLLGEEQAVFQSLQLELDTEQRECGHRLHQAIQEWQQLQQEQQRLQLMQRQQQQAQPVQ